MSSVARGGTQGDLRQRIQGTDSALMDPGDLQEHMQEGSIVLPISNRAKPVDL